MGRTIGDSKLEKRSVDDINRICTYSSLAIVEASGLKTVQLRVHGLILYLVAEPNVEYGKLTCILGNWFLI